MLNLKVENSPVTDLNDVSAEVLSELTNNFLELKAKVSKGYEVTVEDMRLIILYNRAIRKYKLSMVKTKSKVKHSGTQETIIKAISRKRALELEVKEDITKEEQVALDTFLSTYNGKMLNSSALHLLLLKEFQGTATKMELKDIHITINS